MVLGALGALGALATPMVSDAQTGVGKPSTLESEDLHAPQ